MLEKYLEEGELSAEDLQQALVAGTRAGAILPVLCGSATRELGITPLLRAIAELLPSAADRPAAFTSAEGEEIAPDPDAPFTAQVIKTSIDRYTGTLSIFRVVSGRIHADTPILDATRETRSGSASCS